MEHTDHNAAAMQNRRDSKSKNGNIDIKPDQALLERVRGKQAKRKAEDEADEQDSVKKQCQREERIALVQLKAYWDCYPLQTGMEQLRKTRDAESSEDELIEDNGQEQSSRLRPGPSNDSIQELIVANVTPNRRRYLEELRECIKCKGEATQEKKKKA